MGELRAVEQLSSHPNWQHAKRKILNQGPWIRFYKRAVLTLTFSRPSPPPTAPTGYLRDAYLQRPGYDPCVLVPVPQGGYGCA